MVRELVNALASLEAGLVEHPQQREVVLSRCFRVCSAVMQCLSAAGHDPVWNRDARDAERLSSLFHRYRTRVFPAFLERMVTVLSEPALQHLNPYLPSMILSAVACCSSVLRLGDNSWPHRRAVSPSLVSAIYHFARCPASRLPMPETVSNALLDTVAQIMSSISTEGTSLHPVITMTSLRTEVFNMSGSIGRTALDAQMPTRPIFTSLALLVISGHLIERAHEPTAAEAPAAAAASVALAKLAVVTASRCDVMLPEHVEAAHQMIGLMMSMDLRSVAGGVSLMEFVRALHRFWSRQLTLSPFVAKLLMRQHQQSALEADAFRALRYTLHTCMTKALAWVADSQAHAWHQLGDEMHLISHTIVQVSATASGWTHMGRVLPPAKAELDAWHSSPRFVVGMEALLRGNQEEEVGLLVFLMGASAVLRHLLRPAEEMDGTGLAPESETAPAIYGLMITMRKVILTILEHQSGRCMGMGMGMGEADMADSEAGGGVSRCICIDCGGRRRVDWSWPPVQFLVQNLLKILLVTDASMEESRDSFRLYMVIGTTLQPLVRKLLVHKAAGFMASDFMDEFPPGVARHPVPNCDLAPVAWIGCVEDYARRFRGRLLPGCCHLGCKNLSGAKDCLLPTRLCAGCRRARYCSEGCHMEDWAAGGHGLVCGKGEWSISGQEARVEWLDDVDGDCVVDVGGDMIL